MAVFPTEASSHDIKVGILVLPNNDISICVQIYTSYAFIYSFILFSIWVSTITHLSLLLRHLLNRKKKQKVNSFIQSFIYSFILCMPKFAIQEH